MEKIFRLFEGAGAARAQLREGAGQFLHEVDPDTLAAIQPILGIVLDSRLPSWLCIGNALRFVYNDAYASLLGRKHPAAMGQPLWSVWAEIRADFEPTVGQTLAGQSAYLEDVQFTVERNGQAEQAWFTFSTTPVRGAGGAVVGLYTTVSETTRQVLGARALALQQARFRTIFEQAPGFVAILRGADHVFEVVNEAYRRLVGRQELLGLDFKTALPELVGQGLVELLDQVRATGTAYTADHVAVMLQRLPGGPLEERVLEFVYQPITERDGAISGIFVEGSDVTEEHRARAEVAARVAEIKRAEARLEFQLQFSDQIRHVSDPGVITHTASSLLGQHLRASRVHYANVRGDSSTMDVQSMWAVEKKFELLPATRQIRDYGAAIHDALAGGEVVVVADVANDPRTAASSAAYQALDVAAFLCVPLVKSGQLLALLSVHQLVPTDWSAASVEMARDIAERTWDALERAQAEKNLIIERDDSERILNRINEGFVTIGSDWTVLQINAEGLVLGQRQREEVIGKNLWEVWPEIVGTEIEVRYRHAMATESPDLFEQFSTYPGTAGRWIELRLYFVGSGVMAVMFRDISERHENEERLRASEARARAAAAEADRERRLLDALLDAAPVGIGMADASGRLFRVNQANVALWGGPLSTSKSVDDYDHWNGWWADGSARHGQRLQAGDWALARALRGEKVTFDMVEIETVDSPPLRRIINLSAAAVRDAAGQIVGGVVAQTDITALVEAETALRQADARKDEFLAMLAHELRNPLAPISAAAELLTLASSDAARVKRSSAIIRRQVGHLTALVDDLLDVSRVTRGLVELDRQAVELAEVLANAIEQARPLMEAKRHQLSVNGGDTSARVDGDRKRLVQVVVNILNNAARYTPAQGVIELDVAVSTAGVLITVSDNGIGMTEQTVSNVFDLFVQAERTSDRSQGGLGIGLALVRRLVELHGGSVSASSAGLGKGSCFSVTIPLVDAGQAGMAPPAEPDTVAGLATAAPLSIMVVDDNADAADMLAAYLACDGHSVVVAASAGAALQQAALQAPQVFLLDIGLPDFDGNELARQLRQLDATRNAALIAITGYGQERDIAASSAAGFDYHLVKPIAVEQLRELLSQLA